MIGCTFGFFFVFSWELVSNWNFPDFPVQDDLLLYLVPFTHLKPELESEHFQNISVVYTVYTRQNFNPSCGRTLL